MLGNRSFAGMLLLMLAVSSYAQTITVTNDQGLAFGSFSQTSNTGGTVTVSNNGARSSTGAVLLVSSTCFASIFTIATDNLSPLTITIDQPSATLSGSNGGSMALQIGTSNPASPVVSVGSPVEVFIGGTLTLAGTAANPPGIYTGNVLITFTVNNE